MSARADILLYRREQVARLRLRGLTMREIIVALASLKDREGQPAPIKVSVATVHRDLKLAEADWLERASSLIDERKAKQLAEIDEAKRKCWTDGDMNGLARFMKLEADLFGTNAPIKHTWESELGKQGVNAKDEFEWLVDQAQTKLGQAPARLAAPDGGGRDDGSAAADGDPASD